MNKDIKKLIANRRSYYNIDNKVSVSDKDIKDIMELAILHVPSAFNSQSTRIVLLLNDHHKKLWSIVKETLRKITPPESFSASENKIDHSFAAGYGTVLFFEDQDVIKNLQNSFPTYSDNFPIWSQQTSAMHQYVIWALLEEAGLGVSLQHYNPLIDDEVARTWNIAPSWKLIAQMPFGNPLGKAGEKEYEALNKRLKIFE